MNLQKLLYDTEKNYSSLGKDSKDAAEIVGLAKTYFDKEKGIKPFLDVVKGYEKGKKSLDDEHVLMLASVLNSGTLDEIYKKAEGYLSKNPAYGKARKVAEGLKKSASYMKKVGKKFMDYIGKNNLGQLYRIEDDLSNQKKQAMDVYKQGHGAIAPYIKKYTKK